MSEGLLTVLISSAVAVLAAIIANFVIRRNASDTNETNRLELLLNGQEKRIASLEVEVKDLKAQNSEQAELIKRQSEDTRGIKRIVSKWFTKLWEAWPHDEVPMPLPTEAELAQLEITIPPKPVR